MFNINDLFSDRIGGKNYLNNTKLSYLQKIQNKKQELLKNNQEILDFASGDFISEASNLVLESLIKNSNKENNMLESDYSLEFNKSCAGYLRVEQALDLDYKSEIEFCSDSEEILNYLPLAFINKDDYIITTNNRFNEISNMSKWLGCNIYQYNLQKFNNYLIDFEDIDEKILKKCKILYINYPNNPTGAVATREFFKEVVKFAKKYNFIVVNEGSYVDLCFDEKDKVSLLAVDGGKDIGIEIYNVIKHKVGFVAGNKNIIKAYKDIKNNMSIETPNEVQIQGVTVINNYENINKDMKEICLRRHNSLKEILEKHGFKCEVPKFGLYEYVRIPKSCNGVTFESAEEFAMWMLDNISVVVTPYDILGKYISFSIGFIVDDIEKEKEILSKLDEKLSKFKFDF